MVFSKSNNINNYNLHSFKAFWRRGRNWNSLISWINRSCNICPYILFSRTWIASNNNRRICLASGIRQFIQYGLDKSIFSSTCNLDSSSSSQYSITNLDRTFVELIIYGKNSYNTNRIDFNNSHIDFNCSYFERCYCYNITNSSSNIDMDTLRQEIHKI